MSRKLLLADIGGTHTRVRLMELSEDLLANPRIITDQSVNITEKQILLDFLGAMLRVTGDNRPALAVLCFAGPVNGARVSMTNWSGAPELTLAELVKTGLPSGSDTLMVNDMDAAAGSLIAHLRNLSRLETETLYTGAGRTDSKPGNSVMLIPGTGVGIAGVIAAPLTGQPGNLVSVSCELQHMPIPELDEEQGKVLATMRETYTLSRPSWEDFVSGKGLEKIYACLPSDRSARQDGGKVMAASEIAFRAVKNMDERCVSALDIYYRCAGGLAQMVALGFQAFGGIYLAGESTRNNLSFIRQCGFLEALQNNRVRRDWLKLFPVYLVASDVNLAGSAYIAAQYAGID
jgi:glucokinase